LDKKLLYNVVGNIHWNSNYGKQKQKVELSHDPIIQFLGICPKAISMSKRCLYFKVHHNIITTANVLE
jgi:hypothetical protein